MVSGLVQAGKAGIQSFTIEGNEISAFVNTLQVFETLCKPYLTARAIIIDDKLIIDGMKLVGGENVRFTFITEGGGEYSAELLIFSVKKDQSNKNKRALVYEMDLLGKEYFGDRTQLVQKTYKNRTGTDIIKNLHSEFLGGSLQILMESMGLLFPKNSHVINSVKPFKAIDDMRKMITFAKYPSGTTVYYHDKDSAKLAPAEYLMEQASKNQGVTYVEKATWGASWTDIAGSVNAIIDYTTNIDQNEQGRLKISDITAMKKQEYKVMDTYSNKLIFNNLAALIPNPIVAGVPFSSLAGGTIMGLINKSLHGGSHNYLKVDTQKIPAASVRRTDRENIFRASLANSPQIYVKVPIQGGLRTTVGAGVNLAILPPIGDLQTGSADVSELSGPALVCDLTHDVHNDSTLSSTVLRCLKGGFAT